MRVKCLAQEHNAMTLVRAQTRAARPGDERTNHEATAASWLVLNQVTYKYMNMSGLIWASGYANIMIYKQDLHDSVNSVILVLGHDIQS